MRQDPNSYTNVAGLSENDELLKDLRKLLVDWMVETEHPALELMKDPFNQELIDSYMAYEKCNAFKQLEEVETKMPSNATCPWPGPATSSESSDRKKYIWIGAGLLCLLPIAVIARILYHKHKSSPSE